jgi:hypothetical protein
MITEFGISPLADLHPGNICVKNENEYVPWFVDLGSFQKENMQGIDAVTTAAAAVTELVCGLERNAQRPMSMNKLEKV